MTDSCAECMVAAVKGAREREAARVAEEKYWRREGPVWGHLGPRSWYAPEDCERVHPGLDHAGGWLAAHHGSRR